MANGRAARAESDMTEAAYEKLNEAGHGQRRHRMTIPAAASARCRRACRCRAARRWISSNAPRSTRRSAPTKCATSPPACRTRRRIPARNSAIRSSWSPSSSAAACRRGFITSRKAVTTRTPTRFATQQRLLQDLGDSMKAFVDDLKAQGNMQRVLVMTFSEFGRRVTENANGGTDHGAAAPMFIVGNKVKAGLLGTYPSLAPQDLFRGRHQIQRGFPQRLCRCVGKLAEDEERADSRPPIRAAAAGLTTTDRCKKSFGVKAEPLPLP